MWPGRPVHYGRGLCGPCHSRNYRAGTLDRFPPRPAVVRPQRRSWPTEDLIAEVQFCRQVLGLTLAEIGVKLDMRVESIQRAFQRAGLPGGKRCGL